MKSKPLTVQDLYIWAVQEGRENYPISILAYGDEGNMFMIMGTDMVTIDNSPTWVSSDGRKHDSVILVGNHSEIGIEEVDIQISETDTHLS